METHKRKHEGSEMDSPSKRFKHDEASSITEDNQPEIYLPNDMWKLILVKVYEPRYANVALMVIRCVSKQLNSIVKVPKKKKKRDYVRITPFLARNGYHELMRYFKEDLHFPWVGTECEYAVENGHVECLKYAYKTGCDWISNQPFIPYKKKRWRPPTIVNTSNLKYTDVCAMAAKYGYLDCLRYLHENGCEWNADTCTESASRGHLDCLKYARENGCKIDSSACRRAAHGGHFECFKYAHEQGVGLSTSMAAVAAQAGRLELLVYMQERKVVMNREVIDRAIIGGRLECLKYAIENKFPHSNDIFNLAVEHDLECLKYLRSVGFTWDAISCRVAAASGNVDTLRYLHENGCPWDEYTIISAVRRGNFECLKYAHENGCPWSEKTHEVARNFCGLKKKTIICDYLRDNGCPGKTLEEHNRQVLLSIQYAQLMFDAKK